MKKVLWSRRWGICTKLLAKPQLQKVKCRRRGCVGARQLTMPLEQRYRGWDHGSVRGLGLCPRVSKRVRWDGTWLAVTSFGAGSRQQIPHWHVWRPCDDSLLVFFAVTCCLFSPLAQCPALTPTSCVHAFCLPRHITSFSFSAPSLLGLR